MNSATPSGNLLEKTVQSPGIFEQFCDPPLRGTALKLPREMLQSRRWLVWRAEPDPKLRKKPRKVPYYANGQRRGANDTPEDMAALVGFDEACAAIDAAIQFGNPYTGLGFALGPDGIGQHWQGIDLDDLDDNGLQGEADALPGYVEWSPSGRGVHAIGYGARFENKKSGGVELYSTGRYFTVTGHRIRGEVCDISEHAEKLRLRYNKAKTPPPEGARVLSLGIPDPAAVEAVQQLDYALAGKSRDDLCSALSAIPADEYDEWIRVGFALKTVADQEDGFRLWNEWSQRSPENYPGADEARRKWDQDLPAQPAGHWKAIFNIAAAYGWANPQARAVVVPIEGGLDGGRDALPSQDELALDFVAANQEKILYCAQRGQWYKFHNGVWAEDSTGHVFDGIRNAIRERVGGREDANNLLTSGSVAGAERLAQNDQRVAVTLDKLDADPVLLNTCTGVVDLRSGEVRSHAPEYLMTKVTLCEIAPPGTPAPIWQQFLEQVTGHDIGLIEYLQRLVGYGLTGLTHEHVLNFFYGSGRNGKGVFLNTITKLMGSYSGTAPSETFMAAKFNAHPTELASLMGKRLVVAQEVSEGARWDEARIRMLTGGDRITARFMRQDFFEFDPTHTLIIAGNHKPKMSTLDEAGLARMRVVPFTVTIPPEQRDPHLEEKLRAEWPAILRWAAEGARAFLHDGLGTCSAVKAATEDYVVAEDLTAQWVEEMCERQATARTLLKDLFVSWKLFAERGHHYLGNDRRLSEGLERLGFKKCKTRDGMAFQGVVVRPLLGPTNVQKNNLSFM